MHYFLYSTHCVRAKSTTKASDLTRTCWPFYLLKFENDGQATNWLDVWPIGINTCTFKSVEKFFKVPNKVGCHLYKVPFWYSSIRLSNGPNHLVLFKVKPTGVKKICLSLSIIMSLRSSSGPCCQANLLVLDTLVWH